MTRCDYDTIFQRVFCVTLVAIAFTFTVILTNVFVDIDGLLSRKDKVKTYTIPETSEEPEIVRKHGRLPPIAIGPQTIYKEGRKYDEEENSFRNKRSLESQNFIFHLKNPKMKSLLTDRLATLLEELDAEEAPNKQLIKVASNETPTANKVEISDDDIHELKTKKKHHHKDVEIVNDKGEVFSPIKTKEHHHKKSKKHDGGSEEDLLHLAMHNILLQGIIGHMDLNEVYRRVHSLVKNFKSDDHGDAKKGKQNRDEAEATTTNLNGKRKISENPMSEESKFLDEIVKCDSLQKDIASTDLLRDDILNNKNKSKKPKITIKTVIDITSLNKDKKHKENNSTSNESIKGIIKLIYNGKAIKFSRMEDDNLIIKTNSRRTMGKITETTPKEIEEVHHKRKDSDVSEALDSLQEKVERPRNPNLYLNRILGEYIKKNPNKLNDIIDATENRNFEAKRLKRQIKIRYEDDEVTTPKLKPKRNLNKEDDELYVEIETHFNGKGMKGEKKKKLIRSLIDKIQKAVQSDINSLKSKKKKHRHIHIKKRTQNPLDKKQGIFTKLMIPFDAVIKRHSDPISKVQPQETPLTKLTNKYGDNWRKPYIGPGFLTASKALNSAENGEVDIDYSKVLSSNGIPKRLQKPLNTDHLNSEEQSQNTYFDVGNLKFFIKNIDGAGLSIGFNQYMDEPPDPETIKIFTGIENLVNTYQNNYEDPETTTESQPNVENDNSILNQRELTSNTDEHVIIRRSIKEDYHSNEYKIIFNSQYLPFKSYQDIFENRINKKGQDGKRMKLTKNGKKKVLAAIKRHIEMKDISSLVGDIKLKPSEILSLANILNRKKRSVNVKRISNLRNKIKLSRFLNTHPKGTRKIIYNNKRSKRQIDKIRIIASDRPHSDEQVYVVSDENLLADRAIIRVGGARGYVEPSLDNIEEAEIPDAIPDEPYPNILPVLFRERDDTSSNFFANRYRHNPLMSKYPHIFMEEISRSKEDLGPSILSNSVEMKPQQQQQYTTYVPVTTESEIQMNNVPLPKVEEIVNAIAPQPGRHNYKLTVKILPKNLTGLNSGFKEIHTSINKSFDKDGVTYVSLLNVSEISKIEMLHKPTEVPILETTTILSRPKNYITTEAGFIKRVQEQQQKMDVLLKNHKKRIDDQLEHLKKERVNLEIMEIKNDESMGNTIDASLPTKQNRPPEIAREDVHQLLASALANLKTTPEPPVTEPTVYTAVIEKSTENNKLMNTVAKNEKLTNEILHQLNKNTEMLKVFLMKLTKNKDDREPPKPKEELHPMMELNVHKFLNSPPIPPFIPHPLPHIEPPKNESHPPIPFVYAYQQPFPLNNFHPSAPLASVVYHGHIHTNTLHKTLVPKLENKDMNQTKYFIDDLENDSFKVVPPKKPIVLTSNNNTTVNLK